MGTRDLGGLLACDFVLLFSSPPRLPKLLTSILAFGLTLEFLTGLPCALGACDYGWESQLEAFIPETSTFGIFTPWQLVGWTAELETCS
mmetsp:Transcript_29260/g.45842  ORF Transcript_29260/g.45842 Transcript_29260/m.45842 type:complete len:89 (-) Transcript_29260:468-734(-)